jgi:hypothetical protein
MTCWCRCGAGYSGSFIVDGDLTMYLIPSQVIAGRVQILLHTYTKFIVGNAAGLMAPRPAVA